MKQLLRQRQFQISAALIVADIAVFTLVDPLHASAVWLIVGYLLFGGTLLALSNVAAGAFKGYGDQTYSVSRRVLRYSAILAMILVGLQSIGQLTIKDVLTLLPFAVVLYLYYGYGKKTANDDP